MHVSDIFGEPDENVSSTFDGTLLDSGICTRTFPLQYAMIRAATFYMRERLKLLDAYVRWPKGGRLPLRLGELDLRLISP